MVERVTQRANFGNLNPKAKQIDTFRRPDARGLDEFVDWWDSRLKATSGFIKDGFGANASYRESKQEEIRLKAKADAVKNFYNPKKLEDPNVDLDTDTSFASYNTEVKNTQDALKGIEAGKLLINDDMFVSNIFKKTKLLNNAYNETGHTGRDVIIDLPEISSRGLKVDEETGEYSAEQIFQKEKEEAFKKIPKNSGAFYIEKYNEAWNAVEDKFFKTLQKETVNQRVSALGTLTQAYIDSGDLEFSVPQGLEINPEEYDNYFYGKLGMLLEKGEEMGLERSHAQSVILTSILSYADSFAYKTKNQEAGEITEEEEEHLIKIMTALDSQDTKRSFVKSGSSVSKNPIFAEAVSAGIDRINSMLEKKDKDDESDTIKTHKRQRDDAQAEIYQKIASGHYKDIGTLNLDIDKEQKKGFNIDFRMNVNSLITSFESFKRGGGTGNQPLFRKLKYKLTTGDLNIGDFEATENFFEKDSEEFGDLTTLSDQEKLSIFTSMITPISGSMDLQKVILKQIESDAITELAGDENSFEDMLKDDKKIKDGWVAIQLEYNEAVESFLKEGNYSKLNPPSVPEQSSWYQNKIKPLFKEKILELKKLRTNSETQKFNTKIILDDLENTVPSEYFVVNKEGVPENFYRDALYFTDRDRWEDWFEDEYPVPPPALFNRVATSSEKLKYIEEVQKHILQLPKAPNASYKSELSMNNWYKKLNAIKPDLSKVARDVLNNEYRTIWHYFSN